MPLAITDETILTGVAAGCGGIASVLLMVSGK